MQNTHPKIPVYTPPSSDFDAYSDAELHDKGPWAASEDGRSLYSDDFTHDVVLKLSGDFFDDKQRRLYAENLVKKLNTPVQSKADLEAKLKSAEKLIKRLENKLANSEMMHSALYEDIMCYDPDYPSFDSVLKLSEEQMILFLEFSIEKRKEKLILSKK
jgi:hypothetical protein